MPVKIEFLSGPCKGAITQNKCHLSRAVVGRVLSLEWFCHAESVRVLEVFSPYSAEQEWEIAVACWDAALDEDDQNAAGEWAGRCAAKLEKAAAFVLTSNGPWIVGGV